MGFDVLVGRRLQRELRRREAALREADRNLGPTGQKQEAQIAPGAFKPKAEPLVTEHTARTRSRWECDFCGRGFHGIGQLLNHKCHDP